MIRGAGGFRVAARRSRFAWRDAGLRVHRRAPAGIEDAIQRLLQGRCDREFCLVSQRGSGRQPVRRGTAGDPRAEAGALMDRSCVIGLATPSARVVRLDAANGEQQAHHMHPYRHGVLARQLPDGTTPLGRRGGRRRRHRQPRDAVGVATVAPVALAGAWPPPRCSCCPRTRSARFRPGSRRWRRRRYCPRCGAARRDRPAWATCSPGSCAPSHAPTIRRRTSGSARRRPLREVPHALRGGPGMAGAAETPGRR